MPEFLLGRCVSMLAVLLDILHFSLVSLLIILSTFLISGLENMTA